MIFSEQKNIYTTQTKIQTLPWCRPALPSEFLMAGSRLTSFLHNIQLCIYFEWFAFLAMPFLDTLFYAVTLVLNLQLYCNRRQTEAGGMKIQKLRRHTEDNRTFIFWDPVVLAIKDLNIFKGIRVKNLYRMVTANFRTVSQTFLYKLRFVKSTDSFLARPWSRWGITSFVLSRNHVRWSRMYLNIDVLSEYVSQSDFFSQA